jgi:hypothetical protein
MFEQKVDLPIFGVPYNTILGGLFCFSGLIVLRFIIVLCPVIV